MSPHDVVAAVCQSLRREAGYWRADGARLVQVAFVPGEGLDPDVAREFAEATQSVPLSETGLGIVAAATSGEVAVSRGRASILFRLRSLAEGLRGRAVGGGAAMR